MSLVLINSQSNQQIPLDRENPLILGRNNVLGCFDKKVSRTHGRITWTENGKINLVALHTNPCFFMRNGVPPIRQLNKDEEETLNEGDCLGLLPNSFWFQILSSGDAKIKKERDEGNGESLTGSKSGNSEIATTSETQNAGFESEYSKRIGSPEFEKTKKLPLSMYETDEIKSSSGDVDGKIKKLKFDKDMPNETVENNEEGNRDEKEASTSKVCHEGTVTNNMKSEKETNSQENPESVSETKTESTVKRPLCQYEYRCFRKNPQHKLDFCHPDDSDYVPYEKRPLCQYGEACYRRSERHKAEFRHVGSPNPRLGSPSHSPPSSIASSPLPPKRRRKKVKRDSEYEDEDEYDTEDPFINDASSDEYVLSDTDSEEDFDESQEI